jgi:hypothetical protein
MCIWKYQWWYSALQQSLLLAAMLAESAGLQVLSPEGHWNFEKQAKTERRKPRVFHDCHSSLDN